MKKQKKSILVPAVMVVFICTGLYLPGLISAGDLEPSAAPAPTMHTLNDIYHKVEILDFASVVEKTGQTKCYDASGDSWSEIDCENTGQDGDIQAGAEGPDPRFTDNSDGTVTDNLTGLIWLKNINCFGTRLWAQALSDCNNLNDTECGLTDGSVAGDWRLPNVREYLSMLYFGGDNPPLASGHPFSGLPTTPNYWSSTTDMFFTTKAWSVGMINGFVEIDVKDSDSFKVWPVKGGQ